MKSKKKSIFWLSVVLFSLVGQVAWVVENMYFNVFIYNMFSASASDIALMVGASSVVATLTTVFIGALSDKLGKRKAFLSFGYILWGISIISFALIRKDTVGAIIGSSLSVSSVCITLTVIMDCVMTFFGSSANDACFNAWLTDMTSDGNRGAVEGVNAMMPLMAILVVFGGFMSFDLTKPSSWSIIFLIIGITVIAIGVLSIFIMQESSSKKQENKGLIQNILYTLKPSTAKEYLPMYLTLLAFAIFGISIQIFMPYLIIYYEVSLSLSNYVLIMAPAIVIAGAVTAVYGRCYDRLGFGASISPALVCLALGYLLLGIFENVATVFIGSLLMMTGYLSGMAVFGAKIRDCTPENKAGSFQGLRIVGQVLIPGLIGPAIGAAVLKGAEVMVGGDGTTSFIPNQNIFWAALAALVATAILIFLLKKQLKNNK